MDETPADNSPPPIDHLVIRRKELDQRAFPDLVAVDSVVLYDGPRVRKIAKRLAVRNRHTGADHHNVLMIETVRRGKSGEFTPDDKHTVSLRDQHEDEIARLGRFIATFPNLSRLGPATLILDTGEDPAQVAAVTGLIRGLSSAGQAQLLADALALVGGNPAALQALAQQAAADPGKLKAVSAAINVARYRAALDQLRLLIESDAEESAFQALLERNAWMFGSEYNHLLPRRRWTRDEQQDFMLQRTVDGYLELVEIKTPLNGKTLFVPDRSHDSLYARSELSAVFGQVATYLEKLDRDRNSIVANDGLDVNKIRAKVFIGRDGDDRQREALRRYNAHVQRIEVFTFDQLVNMAGQVIATLASALEGDDDTSVPAPAQVV